MILNTDVLTQRNENPFNLDCALRYPFRLGHLLKILNHRIPQTQVLLKLFRIDKPIKIYVGPLIIAAKVYNNIDMSTLRHRTNIVGEFKKNKKCAVTLVFCAFFAASLFSGCGQPDLSEYPRIASTSQSPSFTLPVQYRLAGISVQHRLIMGLIHGYGPEVILIIATIHGNEPAGTPLVRQLNDYLQQHPELLIGKTVVLLPIANPDGLKHGKRYNVNDVDLNRNFEAANRRRDVQGGPEALSEPEARAIYQLIEQYNPDRIVSIHQPLTCIDYDGPGQMLAEQMAQYCDLPVKKLGARPGSLGSYAGVTLGIPIITFEMKKDDSNLEPQILWQKYGKALLAAIVYPEPVQ